MPNSSLSPFIDQQYSSVYAYAGTTVIKARLVKLGAMVVLGEDDTFLGVLTPTDVLLRSHHLVIDCLRSKPTIHADRSVAEALHVMLDAQETVLPVVHRRGELFGLLHQHTLVRHLMKETPWVIKTPTNSPPLR